MAGTRCTLSSAVTVYIFLAANRVNSLNARILHRGEDIAIVQRVSIARSVGGRLWLTDSVSGFILKPCVFSRGPNLSLRVWHS